MAEDLDLITKAEAAQMLTVSEKTVTKLIDSGVLPGYRISRNCMRLRRSEVLAYVEERQVKVRQLQKVKSASIKDIKRKKALDALPCPYKPGMEVVKAW